MRTTEPLALSKIDRTAGTQARGGTNDETVADYKAAYEAGEKMPPPLVYNLGPPPFRFVLVDGFHRIEAARRAGIETLSCEIETGRTLADARFEAAGANRKNGLRLTQADKRAAVRMALEARPDLSDNRVAAHVGGDHKTVATVRRNLGNSQVEGLRVGLDGKARRLPPPRPTVAAPPAEHAPAPPKDPTGRTIPEDKRDLWNRRADLRQIGAQVNAARRALEALIDGKDPLVAHITPTRALAHFKNAAGEIDAAVPAFLCPYCQGLGCRACKGQGFVSRFQWRTTVPAELKTANGGTEDGSEADNGTPEPEEVPA